MTLSKIRIRDFRCLDGVELLADPELNLVVGKNAAGKTSLLEAIYYIGRGRSFRGGSNAARTALRPPCSRYGDAWCGYRFASSWNS